MTETTNPLAPHHLPWFITPPGQTDALLVAMAIFLVLLLVVFGNLYFKLHALPEQWAHKTGPLQVQIVAVLALLALFTHNHAFWVAALLLALVPFPDFSTPIHSMARSLRRLVGRDRPASVALDVPPIREPQMPSGNESSEAPPGSTPVASTDTGAARGRELPDRAGE